MNKFYLLFIISFFYLSHTQAQSLLINEPGGVSGSVLWMKTVPVTTDLNGRYRWKDFSGGQSILYNYNSQGPDKGTEYLITRSQVKTFNFNPALDPTETGVLNKQILIRQGNLAQSTIFSVVGQDYGDFNIDQFLYMVNGRSGEGFVSTRSKIIESDESGLSPLEYGTGKEQKNLMPKNGEAIDDYHQESLRSMTYSRSFKPNYSVWGEKNSSVVTLGMLVSSDNNLNSSYSNTPTHILYGYIPEFIVYNRILTPIERRKIESYLAIKYGFTLDMSYINNTGKLLWDIEESKEYNNRITGVSREDISGLYQDFSSTSYEEAPYFSDTYGGAYDTYSQNNSNNKATPYRLLFAGRQEASPLADGDYIMWGDNGSELTTKKVEYLAGIKIMNRRWLLKTNRKNNIETKLSWNTIEIEPFEEDGFISTITKSTAGTGSITTTTPLQTVNGYFSFNTSFNLGGGSIQVKFGGNNTQLIEGSNDYGYLINTNGSVYKIVKGEISKSVSATVRNNQKIEIEKKEDILYLWINGVRQSSGTIEISEEDRKKEYYGSINITKGTKEITLNNLRHGGFVDTGNRLELSYVGQRATEFKNYRNNNQAYILIDRSGTGDFKKEDTELYVSDEYDEDRSKIIFNNIFFDTDQNGKDVFTFGYRESNIIANVEKSNPSCDIDTGETKADGKIDVKIQQGDAGFEYQLLNKQTSKIVKSGVFYEKNLELDSLLVGDYTLKLKELGGFHVISDSTEVEAKAYAHQVIGRTNSGLIEFTIKEDNQSFQAGMNPLSHATDFYVQYGFEVKDGLVYTITNKVKSTVPLAGVKVKAGDRIQMYKDSKDKNTNYKIYYQINGTTFYTQTINLSFCFFMVKLNNNVGGIYNVKNTDGKTYFNPANWTYHATHSEPQTDKLSETSVEHEITLTTNCTKKEEPLIETPVLYKEGKNMTTYYKDFNNMSEITTQIKLDKPSPISIGIFNYSGVMVYHKDIKESNKEHTVDIQGLPRGVYILKVFSSEGEFTKKIIIN